MLEYTWPCWNITVCYQLIRSLHTLSNHSPLMNQTMVPFMSAVSCLFLPADSRISDYSQHHQHLQNLGDFRYILLKEMEIVVFHQLLFHWLHRMRKSTRLYLTYCLILKKILDILHTTHEENIRHIAHNLRLLAVAEWTDHTEEYVTVHAEL